MKYGTRIEFDSRRLIRGRPADAVKFLDAIYVYDSKCRYKGVWFFQNNQIFWTSPSECTCAKLVNALSSASESPFHLKFHSSYYQWYQSTRTRQSPRFCIKIEKTCNEIGVAANNMTLNTGHQAMVFIFESCILLMPFSAVKIRKDGRSAKIQ